MHPLESLAQLSAWGAKSMAYNLDFIPEDRMDWRPTPTAKSALDIANHLLSYAFASARLLRGGVFDTSQFRPARTRAEAKEMLHRLGEEYPEALRMLAPEDLEKSVELPFGTIPLSQAASMPVVDLLHHHGQIAYIQTLLGDEESHFVDG
jgi:uncharacterized damage-inducible protein DinB